jgi:hypothetical protein
MFRMLKQINEEAAPDLERVIAGVEAGLLGEITRQAHAIAHLFPVAAIGFGSSDPSGCYANN